MPTQLHQVGKEIWIYEGSTVSFYGFPFSTRMTVVRLENGDLWLHSPEKINSALMRELTQLGIVRHLVSPNKLHHLFLPEWIEAYPEAITCAAPGLAKKRADIHFHAELAAAPRDDWKEEIDQTIFRGSRLMEEVVFFHRSSRTLIVTDLIENLNPRSLNPWQRRIARVAGILSPKGKMPIDWRVSFRLGGMIKARESLDQMLGWQPENIILSHGECVFGGGAEFLKASFSWLKP
jgi:hypothetical protein